MIVFLQERFIYIFFTGCPDQLPIYLSLLLEYNPLEYQLEVGGGGGGSIRTLSQPG